MGRLDCLNFWVLGAKSSDVPDSGSISLVAQLALGRAGSEPLAGETASIPGPSMNGLSRVWTLSDPSRTIFEVPLSFCDPEYRPAAIVVWAELAGFSLLREQGGCLVDGPGRAPLRDTRSLSPDIGYGGPALSPWSGMILVPLANQNSPLA